MFLRPRTISPRHGPAYKALQLTRLEDRVNPGSGTFDAATGTFDFCVSLRFNASDAEIALIKSAFQTGSDVLADATDGQHRFGQVSIMNNSGGGAAADFWIFKQDGRPNAPLRGYGARGLHSNLYLETSGNLYGGPGDGAGYTVAHEFGHLAYGIGDEYSGPGGNAENATPSAESATLNYSLMDNYFTRGGRAVGGGFTLNEFSVKSNFDLADPVTKLGANNTFQYSINKVSDWETIAASKFKATAPAGLPVDAAPASQAVTFDAHTGVLHAMILIDRSGSMSGDRIDFAKAGGQLFTYFVGANDSLGVADFDDQLTLDLAMAKATDAQKAAARAAIDTLTARGSTAIGGGLQLALGEIKAQPERTCNEVIVLLTDGDNNVPPDPATVIPQLQAEHVAVLAIGVGSGISASGQGALQQIASQTGGRFLSIASNFAQIGLFFRLAMESVGNGLLAQAPVTTLATGATAESRVFVEQGAAAAVFALNREDVAQTLTFTLVSPTGQTIDAGTAGVQVVSDHNTQTLTVPSPAAGEWRLLASGGTSSQQIQFLGAATNPGTDLVVTVESGSVTAPAPVVVHADPQYLGKNVAGAVVSGSVIRPDGGRIPITLFDDGLTTHGDAVAGDGEYSALFTQYGSFGNGAYTFDLQVVNKTGVTVAGEDPLGGTPSDSVIAPAFVRFGSTTAVVTGVGSVTGGFVVGTVFDDRNGNKTQDAGEPGVPGVTVFLDANGNGTLDAGELSTTTGPDGAYQITSAVGGTFTVRQVLPAGATQLSDNPIVVVGAGGVETADFADRISTSVSLVGGQTFAVGADAGGGPTVRSFAANGTERFSVTAFDAAFTGGVRTASGDFNGDGVEDVVVGTGPGSATHVRILDGKDQHELFAVDPFEAAFTGGVFVAAGDVNGDGVVDLLISPDEGGGPRVRAFSGNGFGQIADFFGIDDPAFRGGCRAAVGDFNGDGVGDLIVAAGFGGGPRVAVFDGTSVRTGAATPVKLFGDLFVFEAALRNGAYVTGGDLNGDGFADLIAGGGPGGGPRVFALSGKALLSNTQTQLANFFAGDVNNRGGVRVAVKNLDGDAKADLVVGAGTGGGSRVTAYLGKTVPTDGVPPEALGFDAFAGFTGGVFVG